MPMLDKFINKRYSLRNLSDDYFEEILPVLAEELEAFDYSTKYSDTVLLRDWNNLKLFKTNSDTLNSTTRTGMKILEHFNQNIWSVRGNKTSPFSEMWTKDNLIKVLRWNRKSHSTPYISELRRGIYFCCKVGSKVTMYRPTLAKLICDYFNPNTVYDPCAGWGGRMIGSVASGCYYIGIEPAEETYHNLVTMAKFLEITDKVTLLNISAEEFIPDKIQLVLTSPPYFDLEIYDDSNLQSVKTYPLYEDWTEKFLRGIIKNSVVNLNGISCWNVANYGKYDLVDCVGKYHKELHYEKIKEFCITSSKRPTSGLGKRSDVTYCFGSNNG